MPETNAADRLVSAAAISPENMRAVRSACGSVCRKFPVIIAREIVLNENDEMFTVICFYFARDAVNFRPRDRRGDAKKVGEFKELLGVIARRLKKKGEPPASACPPFFVPPGSFFAAGDASPPRLFR